MVNGACDESAMFKSIDVFGHVCTHFLQLVNLNWHFLCQIHAYRYSIWDDALIISDTVHAIPAGDTT